MTINFSAQPYYDDFSEDKNFHKILFKPGYAVQARELTQTQTILQDQISKLGKFVLSDGSRVSGSRIFSDNNVRVVQLAKTESTLANILDFENLYVVSSSSKLMGVIVDVDFTNLILTIKPLNVAGVNNFQAGETLNLFSEKYLAHSRLINPDIASDYTTTVGTDTTFTVSNGSSTKYSLNLIINTLSLQVGDVLSNATLTSSYTIVEITDGSTCVVDKSIENDFTNITFTVTRYASRKSMQISVDEGVFFTNGYFVKCLAQAIVPNNKTEYPSAVIGLEVDETVQDFIDDESLLDPALGSYNYSAPGADRYVINLTLVSKPLVENSIQDLTTKKFIELVRVKKGVIIKSNLNPTLGELEKTLARQMYDHAGNFFVKPFAINFNENQLLNSQNTLPLEISSGKAYVFGHELDIQYPLYLNTDKARDTLTVSNYDLSTYYGNSIRIKDLYGSLNFQTSPTIELHSNSTGQAFSTKIGTALARNFKYNTANDFNLYLYDIKLNKTADIANVKSVVITTSANNYSSYNFKANTIQTANVTTLTDSKFQSLVFNVPHNNIKSIASVNFESNLLGTYTFTANTTSIFSGSLTTQILGGSGVVSSAIKRQYFYVTAKQTNGSYTAGSVIDTDDLIINISQTGSEYVASFTTTNSKIYNGTADIWYTVQYTNAQPKLKTLVQNQISCVNVTDYKTPVSLGISDIYAIKGVYQMKANNMAYKGTWNSANTYYIGNYINYNNSIYYAINGNSNKNPVSSANNWLKLTPNFNAYTLYTGQNDSYYDHGSFTVNSNLYEGSYIVVYDYFTHGSGSYISQASYPNTVDYKDIPAYRNNNGQIVQLRDCIDFRPRRQNFSTSLVFDSFNIPATTFSGFNLSYDYYLNRIDKLIVTDNKDFKIIKGVPKYTNITPPPIPQNCMPLATIHYNAYGYSKNDIRIVYDNHRRYTMDDIGVLDKRIDRVEYYTSLSLAESEAINKATSDELLKSRLRNGFLIDSFSSLIVADLSNIEHKAAIDLQNELCRPAVDAKNIKLNYIFGINDTGQYITNKLLHFPYDFTSTQSILASNKKATGSINCNPFDVISFRGSLTLSPEVDNWFETNEIPEINTISENTIALDNALGDPSLVYNSWNLYNSQVNTQRDNSKTSVVNVSQGIGYTVESTVVEEIRRNVIAVARSIPIQLNAAGLSPYTRMYVFVNGALVNGYVLYGQNPTGQITGVRINNSGINYASNTTIKIQAGTNLSANATANVSSNGQIIDIEMSKLGVNYATVANTANAQIIISGTGTGASANVILSTRNGNDLYTDSQGYFSCTLMLPCNNNLKFRTGELLISVSDDPIAPRSGSSYAEAIFYSTGDLKTITESSIRKLIQTEQPTQQQSQETIINIVEPTVDGNTTQPITTTRTYYKDITANTNVWDSYQWTLNTNRNIAGNYNNLLQLYANPGTGNWVISDFKQSLNIDSTGKGTIGSVVRDLNQSKSGSMTFTVPAEINGRIIDPGTIDLNVPANVKTYKPSITGKVYNPTTKTWSIIVAIKDAGEGGNEIYDKDNYPISINFNTNIDPQNPINLNISKVRTSGNNGVKDANTTTTLQSGIDISTLTPEQREAILTTLASGGTQTTEQMTITSSTTTNTAFFETSTDGIVTGTTNDGGKIAINSEQGTVVGVISSNLNTNSESNQNSGGIPSDSNPFLANPSNSLPKNSVSLILNPVSQSAYKNIQTQATKASTALQDATKKTDLAVQKTNNLVQTAAPASGTVTAISTFQGTADKTTSNKEITTALKDAKAAIKADTSLTPKEKNALKTALNAEAAKQIAENKAEAKATAAAARAASVVAKPKK